MSVLNGFEAVGEKTTTNKMTMTVMESSVRFSKGVTEALIQQGLQPSESSRGIPELHGRAS